MSLITGVLIKTCDSHQKRKMYSIFITELTDFIPDRRKLPICLDISENWDINFLLKCDTPTVECTNLNKCSVSQFSCSVTSDSLRPHWRQHARPPCPSPTPGVHPNSCPLSWWCHPTMSSSVVPFSSCLQSFPASGSFKWVSSSHQVAKGLEFQLQHQSSQWTPRTDLL